MIYDFQKVYADVVTEDGHVGVYYILHVTLLGRTWPMAGLELYGPDGGRRTWLAADPPGWVAPDAPAEALPRRMTLAGGGEITFEAETVHGAWAPAVPCPCPELEWRVVAGRTRVRLVLPDGETLVGQGYADHVRIRRPTRWIGLRRLGWCRAHVGERTLVIEDLLTTTGHWRLSRSWPGEEGTGELRVGDDGAGELGVGEERLALRPRRLLHAGDALGPDRIPGWVDRTVSRALGGPTGERRWLGAAGAGTALWEQVGFGKAAARAG